MEKEGNSYQRYIGEKIERRLKSRSVVMRLVRICRVDSLDITGVERDLNAPVVNVVYRDVALFTCGNLPFAKAGKLSFLFICAFCIVRSQKYLVLCLKLIPLKKAKQIVLFVYSSNGSDCNSSKCQINTLRPEK